MTFLKKLNIQVVLGILLLGIVLAVSHYANNYSIIGWKQPGLIAGDLNLSGLWRVRFDDSEGYVAPKLDDSGWCSYEVPHSIMASATEVTNSDGCPAAAFPRHVMVNHTYWYRRHFVIEANQQWKDPALFVGIVYSQARVYLDGRQLAEFDSAINAFPWIVPLSQEYLKPGPHVLAIRAVSGMDDTPGISHSNPRKVAIGEKDTSARVVFANKSRVYGIGTAFTMQVMALLLMVLIAYKSPALEQANLWLILYFSASALYSIINALDSSWFWDETALLWMSLGLLGYGQKAVFRGSERFRWFAPLLAGIGASVQAALLVALIKTDPSWGSNERLQIGVSYLCFAMCIALLLYRASTFLIRKSSFVRDDAILLVLSVTQFFPLGVHLGLRMTMLTQYTAVLTLLVISLLIENFLEQQRDLAFYGRYIRKGLKHLLSGNRESLLAGEKVIVGKRVVLLKVDIISHTDTTFGMPYGMKRLFQDLWFTEVDQIVADRCFMDSPEGDGSFYYFEDGEGKKSAAYVLDAIRKIQTQAIPSFDRKFREALAALLKKSPELRDPVNRFLESYKKKAGHGFSEYRTQARFVVLTGHLDEGLWGMSSRGHYTLQGDLNTLAARMEKNGGPKQVLMNREYFERLRTDGAAVEGLQLEWRKALLKGIGEYEIGVLSL